MKASRDVPARFLNQIDLQRINYFDTLAQPVASLCACSAVTTVRAVETWRYDAGCVYKAL